MTLFESEVPLISWEGKNLLEFENLQSLEHSFFPGHTVAFNTTQSAIQCTLELLGTRMDTVPVVVPVTAPVTTLNAVMRSGAHPILLDIDPTTLQIKYDQLKLLKEELDTLIVLFNCPGGAPVDTELLKLCEDLPTILDARMLPPKKPESLCCSFNIFELSSIIGCGGIVIHSFREQVKQLKVVRSGVMGHSAEFPEALAKKAEKRLKSYNINTKSRDVLLQKLYGLNRSDIIPFYNKTPYGSLLYVRVPNAPATVAQLKSYNIESTLGVQPLHKLEAVKQRYQEEPDYPGAEEAESHILALPIHKDIFFYTAHIANIINEVNHEHSSKTATTDS